MKGTCKFFNSKKGWGFLTDSEGNDVFVHHSQILANGFRMLYEGDYVDFEIGTTETNNRSQAINVKPILTLNMVKKELAKNGLHLRSAKVLDLYVVVDRNDVIQTSEYGMSLLELAAYVGLNVEGLEETEDK